MKVIFVPTTWLCFICLEISQVFSFTNTSIYSGSLTPKKPRVCDGQDETFRCEIRDSLLPDGAVHFAVTIPPENYILANENDVIRIDHKSANLTIHAIPPEQYMLVKCYYGQRDDVNNGSLLVDHPVLFPIYPMPKKVQNFQCVVANYDVMNCSWEHGFEYAKDLRPDVTLQWRISGTTEWQVCPELNTDKSWCIWRRSNNGDALENMLDIQVTLEQRVCDASVTSTYTINPKMLVKPNPVSDLRSHVINSTCIRLQWSTYGLLAHDYKILISCTWNVTEVLKSDHQNGNIVDRLREVTLCDLEEDTTYKFAVSQKPRNGGFWSNNETIENIALKDVPGASPRLINGGYYWDPNNCTDGGNMRTVCLLWQNIKPIDHNAEMKGIEVTFTPIGCFKPEVYKPFSEDTTYGCASLFCNVTYTAAVIARNEIGTSQVASTIIVQRWQPNLKQPSFTVEMARNPLHRGLSIIYVSVDTPHDDTTDIYVAWCVKAMGRCMSNGHVNWVRLSQNETTVHKYFETAEKYLFSVSTTSHDISYGSHWEHCIYTKDVAPTVAPQNVIVTTGPEDNTLVITWEKLGCKSGEPLIVAYRVKYCHINSGICSIKDVPSNTSRMVLHNLVEDEEYTVHIQGVASHNLHGPYSATVSGTPENNSLNVGEIIGISCGGLTLVIMASIGCLFAVRLLRKKAIRWKKKVGGVKLPEHIGLDLMRYVNRPRPNLVSA